MRLRARRDANHAEIVKALRAAGRRVLDLGAVGKGCPDLLVAAHGRLVLLEVKAPGGTLTPDQRTFAAAWPVVVVRSPAEAIAATGP
jgi:hypothetical protein